MDSFPTAIRLKYLLTQRHWQKYQTFCAQYDKAAREIDSDLVGTWPSRAQVHRWCAGQLKKRPHPDHCRVLERMFPEWSATQLFELLSPAEAATLVDPATIQRTQADDEDASSSRPGIFIDLSDQDNREIAQRIRVARNIFFGAHTGYNAMVSMYQAVMRQAIADGCQVRIVISDPDGPLMAQPELTSRLCPSIRQEGEIRDVLATCARHRAHAISAGHDAKNVRAAVYRGAPGANILLIDGWLRVIPYLPLVDMAECPGFEYTFDPENPSRLIGKYLLSMERLWADAKLVDLDVINF